MSDVTPNAGRRGLWQRIRSGLERTSDRITRDIVALVSDRRLDDATLEELEDLLITADLGTDCAARLVAGLGRERFDRRITELEIRASFARDIAGILEPVARPLVPRPERKPHVILVCGVNGSGKTTTIGKLAAQWGAQCLSVCLAAGDTFRAAAIEQLEVWGERAGATVVSRPRGTDPSGLVWDALDSARTSRTDVLLIDTAGRLQNRTELMDELAKMVRVIRRQCPDAPHDCLLVLDGTVGQNARSQVAVFREMVDVSGLVVTKLDGSTRGGVVVALAQEFGLPVHAVGLGEGPEDLRPFDHLAFARGLMGLDEAMNGPGTGGGA